jgi:UDP-2,4-diacetamido-2,4,6-trideoxy-beta-L-altropyranose hydrolase
MTLERDPSFKILFRADARPDLGGGHIMRCLSLASTLNARGVQIAFACAQGSVDLVPALGRSGFEVLDADGPRDIPCPKHWAGPPDAIFIDLYQSDRADETALRANAKIIAVIEDLPERIHDCDLLVDQGFKRSKQDYLGRVPAHTNLLLGAHMVPLRPAFARRRTEALKRRQTVSSPERVLIAMGLTDLDGISARMARIVRRELPNARIDVILGPTAPSLEILTDWARDDDHMSVLVDVDDMADYMSAADLAIGAGGGTALERCVLGLPSILLVLADNQRIAAQALAEDGAVLMVDTTAEPELEVAHLLQTLTPTSLRHLALNAASVCDGRGAEHIADALLQLVADGA